MNYLGRTMHYLIRIVAVGIFVVIVLNVMHHFTGESAPVPTTTTAIVTPAPLPTATTPSAVTEDSAGWNCATQGNHICGPNSGHPAGCYHGGQLVIPWTNYTNPRLDPLWARLTAPC